jgi:hypothetical protein
LNRASFPLVLISRVNAELTALSISCADCYNVRLMANKKRSGSGYEQAGAARGQTSKSSYVNPPESMVVGNGVYLVNGNCGRSRR